MTEEPHVPEHGPADIAREEAARQLVAWGAALAALPVAVWIERWLSQPDSLRGLRMKAAKAAERQCATAARWLWLRAEQARLAYERERG